MSFSDISIQELASAFMVLFAVIDITGAVPIINDIQNKGHKISAIKAALASYILLVAFLFVGDACSTCSAWTFPRLPWPVLS